VAGLRAEAESASRAPERGSRLMEHLQRLSQLHLVRDDGYGLELDALRITGTAEQERLTHGSHGVTRWREAANAWERLGMPYPAAYAHLRLGEALLEQGHERELAADHLRVADACAARLGAHPLRHAVAAAAQRGGITRGDAHDTINDSATGTFAQWAARHGLTTREQQVLRLVVQGSSNREIGDQLYIAESTASVHVSRILRKLDVRTRAEAVSQVLTSGVRAD
jgi:DNA-binding CsgD family transcriptional regulator